MVDKEKLLKGINQYNYIIQKFRNTDVSVDVEFQRKYAGFYRVRRNAEWRKIFFNLFEEGKNRTLSFEETLRHIYEKTGRVEASFSSKLIATINTNMPIWDMYVLQYLGLKVKASYKDKEERLAEIVSIYEKMQEFYKSEKAQSLVQKFNALYDGSEVMSMELSDVKKADFMIWGDR